MDIEIKSQPFSREELKKIKRDLRLGKIRRFGAIVSHYKLGFTHNALIAWEKSSVSKKLADQLKDKGCVSHVYLRKSTPTWPYGLYTMIHARNEEELHSLIIELSNLMSGCVYKVLHTVKEFKKTSFSPVSRA